MLRRVADRAFSLDIAQSRPQRHWRPIYGPEVQIVAVVSFTAEAADRPRVLDPVEHACYAWCNV